MENFTNYKLNKDAISEAIKQKGRQLICTEDVQFVYPKRFDDRFTVYGDTIRILGIFAILDTKGNYIVHNLPNKLLVSPNRISTTMIDNIEHVVMTFYKGSIISTDTTLVKDNSYLTELYNELVVLGKIPLFFSYTDLLKTIKAMYRYNDGAVGKFIAPIHLILSLIARDINNKAKPFRYTGKDGKPGEVYYVGLNNIHYSVKSTISKMSRGYFGQALYSATDNDQIAMSEFEELLLT